MEQRIRKLFRRMGWLTPLLRPTGLVPRMTAGQQADSNIELGRLSLLAATVSSGGPYPPEPPTRRAGGPGRWPRPR
jgi:hypothetical protein